MAKSEFLAQENVPEFIKAVVSSLPSDADVEIESFKLGKPRKKESCSCDRVHEDGVDISAYLEGIADRLVSLVDLTDCKGRISRSDLDKAMGQVDIISGTVSQLYNFLVNEPKEGKEIRLPKD
ncbi:hypothetical protein NE673_15715 [Blautia producta]|uniref:hypothetical protein n=1 Tax=Blautia producta TaxID=33035 RepID=UPI00210B2534|nr:hypothetical protein [Blautia producta]MCQ5095500.1 hypothetical protein [Blautia producta]